MKNTDTTDIDTDGTDHRTNQTNTTKLLYPELSYKVIGCIYETRNMYGSGQKEIVYQNAFAEFLEKKHIPYKREVTITIRSQLTGKPLGTYRLDFVVEGRIVIEAKAVKFLPAKMENQLYSYLISTEYEIGYLVNFGSTELFLKRIILTNDRKHLIR